MINARNTQPTLWTGMFQPCIISWTQINVMRAANEEYSTRYYLFLAARFDVNLLLTNGQKHCRAAWFGVTWL